MRYFSQYYLKVVNIFLFLLISICLISIFLHFYTLIQGFYLTGDTISSLEIAHHDRPGSIFQVFKWHYATWPPGLAYVFNFLSALPFSIVSQNQIYVFLISVLNVFIVYLIAKNITQSVVFRIAIIALSLFSGIHSLLFLSAIAEPMFVFFWLATIYLLTRFMENKQENYIFPLIGSMSILPLFRYSGIWLNLGFMFMLLIFIFFDRKRKYSVKFILVSLILAWVPIIIYLIRNMLTDVSIFGLVDSQFKNVTINTVSQQLLKNLIEDLKIPFTCGLLVGTFITWSKKMRNILILCFTSSLVYFTGLVISQTKYRITEHFPSRFSAVTYPELLLATIAIGSFLVWKFPRIKRAYIFVLMLIIIFFGYQIFISAQRLDTELKSKYMWIPEIENSQDIRRLCRGGIKNKYLFIQDSSRNWVGQSLRFYCLPIEKIPLNVSSIKLPQNSLLYTPYKLTIPKLKEEEIYGKEYKIYVYRTETSVDFNVKEELNKRISKLE